MTAPRRIALTAAALACALLSGCGGAGKPEDRAPAAQSARNEAAAKASPPDAAEAAPPASSPEAEAPAPADEQAAAPALPAYPYAQGTASLRGRVVLKEKYRPMDIIDMTGIPACSACWSPEDPPRYETIVTDKDGGLANVIVFVSKGLEGYAFEAPKDPVILDQVRCRFRPHVLSVTVGQPLSVRNLDDTAHNVEFFGLGNHLSNFGDFTETFPEPGVLELHCEAHTWMSAHLMVLAHPFHAVTGADGTFEIKGLIPGTYTLSFWHEYGAFAAPDQIITLKAGEERADVNADFVKQ